MLKLLENKSKLIFFTIFLIGSFTILIMIPKDNFPVNKPKLKITYDNKEVYNINGEFNWFSKEIGGNSNLAEPLENISEPLYAKRGEEINIKFSKAPNSVSIIDISKSPYQDHNLLEKNDKKEYYFLLPDESGEYIFEVNGIWDSTHNLAKIFKVYIE